MIPMHTKFNLQNELFHDSIGDHQPKISRKDDHSFQKEVQEYSSNEFKKLRVVNHQTSACLDELLIPGKESLIQDISTHAETNSQESWAKFEDDPSLSANVSRENFPATFENLGEATSDTNQRSKPNLKIECISEESRFIVEEISGLDENCISPEMIQFKKLYESVDFESAAKMNENGNDSLDCIREQLQNVRLQLEKIEMQNKLLPSLMDKFEILQNSATRSDVSSSKGSLSRNFDLKSKESEDLDGESSQDFELDGTVSGYASDDERESKGNHWVNSGNFSYPLENDEKLNQEDLQKLGESPDNPASENPEIWSTVTNPASETAVWKKSDEFVCPLGSPHDEHTSIASSSGERRKTGSCSSHEDFQNDDVEFYSQNTLHRDEGICSDELPFSSQIQGRMKIYTPKHTYRTHYNEMAHSNLLDFLRFEKLIDFDIIKYQDEEGDWITIRSDEEWKEALRCWDRNTIFRVELK